jgi:hypothetical protein
MKCKLETHCNGYGLCDICRRIWQVSNSIELFRSAGPKEYKPENESDLQTKIWQMWLDGELS